jgi:tetratricopeptide (TPR) repeat protein
MSSLPDDPNRAVTEFADAELGDWRRTQRLVALASVLAQHPTAALPEACGDAAMLKAAYRFFDTEEVLNLLDEAAKRLTPPRLSYASEVYLLAGRLEEAHALALRALEDQQKHQERGLQVHTLWLLGEIAARRDPPDVDQAETYYQQALTLANELGMRPLQAHCHRGLVTLYRQTGQLEPARAELSTAIEMYRDMEMTFWLPETEAALAEGEGTS